MLLQLTLVLKAEKLANDIVMANYSIKANHKDWFETCYCPILEHKPNTLFLICTFGFLQ